MTSPPPGHPASRGKIERFFGTVRRAFLVELEARGGATDLAELNELFGAWVEGVYHRSRHSETNETPLARLRRATPLRRPTPAENNENGHTRSGSHAHDAGKKRDADDEGDYDDKDQ